MAQLAHRERRRLRAEGLKRRARIFVLLGLVVTGGVYLLLGPTPSLLFGAVVGGVMAAMQHRMAQIVPTRREVIDEAIGAGLSMSTAGMLLLLALGAFR